MKVLLLRANPRKTGFTQRLTDRFLQGLQEAGAEVRDEDLTAESLQPCLGCYHCWLATPGQCVHGDAMGPLLEAVLEARVIVGATPLYFFSMAAPLKVFLERLLPLSRQGFAPSAAGRVRNSTRYPDRWAGKTIIPLVIGALKDPAVYQPLTDIFRLIADALDLGWGGALVRPESYLLDYPLSKPKTLRKVEAAFVQAGREAATAGVLAPETIAAAALPLAADDAHFLAYSNFYWDCAGALGEPGLLPGEVQKHVAGNVHILLREMVRCLDPKTTARVRAVLQFEFPDQAVTYHIFIRSGRAELVAGPAAEPDLRVRCASPVWAALFTRQLDVRAALKDGTLQLAGDKSLFARLERFFPPPSA